MSNLQKRCESRLEELKESNNLREVSSISIENHNRIINDEKKFINLSSNNYLGLAYRKDLIKEFNKYIKENKIDDYFSSTSSRLLTGTNVICTRLESKIADAYGKSGALLYNSGYHANTGILSALTSKTDLIIADKFVHASIIDGTRMSKAHFLRFKHLDYNHLREILLQHRDEYNNVFIVTESIFSMDGDVADIQQLVDIKQEYDAFLYVDEAHALGTRGVSGLGICEEQVCIENVDFIVGTFGKAIASVGAFVVCDDLYKQYLINNSRSLIYTTALPPINIAWSEFIFDKLLFFNKEREYLNEISEYVRLSLNIKGVKTKGSSNIIPIIIGSNKDCIEVCDRIKDEYFFVQAIKHPTVPKGSARIRLSLNADIDKKDIDRFLSLID